MYQREHPLTHRDARQAIDEGGGLLARTEPQPDIILLRPPLARYAKTIPGPGDALLIVEVADTSRYGDGAVKVPRYAAAGIPEAWIVDVDAGVADALEVDDVLG